MANPKSRPRDSAVRDLESGIRNLESRVPHRATPLTRRDWLFEAGAGFGAVALTGLLASEAESAAIPAAPSSRSASAAWLRTATARSVIFLFMEGGPSHIDTFDPKPEVNRLAGQPLPPSFK